MKTFTNIKIIGVDHGYGNIKTANHCFPAGVISSDTEPPIPQDLLVYSGKYYLIGAGHKEFIADKFEDEDYYVLTLAAIAYELKKENLTQASVFIAAGLPLTWIGSQKEHFKEYLLKNKTVDFTFRHTDYHIEIVGADVFPQGYAAIFDKLTDMDGITMMCDIGNGTMNLMKIVNHKPDLKNMFTEKFGTHQCTLAVRESMMKTHHVNIDDAIVTDILRTGTANINEKYLETIISTVKEYTKGIFDRLKARDYDPEAMNLYVTGGGGCLIKNFADIDRVTSNEDICANAKGFEFMAHQKMIRGRYDVLK